VKMNMEPVSRNTYTRLVASLLFPLHERLKGHDSVARLHALEHSQWWPPTQLAEYRLRQLRDYLVHIGTYVPYYLDLFRRLGFEPGALASLADLQNLPMLDKHGIRTHHATLKSEQAGSLTAMATGGSSGEPLRYWVGRDRISHDVAAKWRATRWWGVDIGDPELVIWGSPIEVGNQDRVRAWRDRILRSRLVSAFALNEASMTDMLAILRRQRPAMLFGYPSALARLCEFAEAHDQHLDELGIRVAFVTSERLYDHQRTLIGRVLGCPVANGYGGRDAGFLAHECPAGGMHISAEDIIVETVDEQGRAVPAGNAGEIVVTHLANGDFPLLRYRTGDVGVLDDRQCVCGRGLPLIRELQGRSTDFVQASDGTVMHGLALIYILRELAGLRTFKITQLDLTHTRVELVTEAGFDPGNLDRIRAQFRRRLGEDVQIEVACVAAIPPEASGKYRYVVSHVQAT